MRVVGKRHGILTLVADIAKGFVPVIVALNISLTPTATAFVGIAAFLGHLYPVFLRFQGGKRSGHGSGGFLGAGALGHTRLNGNFCSGPSGHPRCLSKFNGGCCLRPDGVLAIFYFSPIFTGMSLFIAVMIVLRHRGNIQRLLSGTEPRLGTSSSR